MADIMGLFACCSQCLERPPIRRLRRVGEALLSLTGRVTMQGMARWADKGGSDRTLPRFFTTSLRWGTLQWVLSRHHLCEHADGFVMGGDEVVVTKSGKQTYGLDRRPYGRPQGRGPPPAQRQACGTGYRCLCAVTGMAIARHVVYSSVCKHLYLYARSRRTSGLPWRPVSGPRPPLPYAAARSSSPVPRASRPPRLRTTCAAPIRPSATPFMRSTSAASLCCSPSRRARTPWRPSSTAGACESLRALLHQSPRTFGKPTSRWTLALAAEVSFAQGLTPRLVSDETIRLALRRLRVTWKRAKHWITSPDPAYARKKNGATS